MLKHLTFVIQKHDATSLHFDFRLEVNGKMPSWAIPKGPTLDNSIKRLAFKVEDHDLKYQHFEGNLKEGGYGAGPVMIWDNGFYIPEVEISKGVRKQIKDLKTGQKIMADALKKGEIKFFLNGKKIKGSFALVKTKGFPPGKSENAWLLIKHNDQFVQPNFDAKDKSLDYSVVSKKTLDEIATLNRPQ